MKFPSLHVFLVLLLVACVGRNARAEETPLHSLDSADGIETTWSDKNNPDALIERNADKAFISEGSGSILARSVAPAESSQTSYIGFRVPVDPLRLEGKALAFDVWSSEPDNTTAFYVRGLDADGKIVAGWNSWLRPLSVSRQTLTLNAGMNSGPMLWEKSRIDAPENEIVSLEFIAGSREWGKAYSMIVDHVRLVPEEKSPAEKDASTENVIDHGVMAPAGMATWGDSVFATVDGGGKRLVFMKIWNGSQSSYLFVDPETGKTDQIYPENQGEWGWGAYEVFMTPENVAYDTIGDELRAIDIPTRKTRSLGKIGSGMALSYGKAADGTIYAGIYPHAVLVSYDPAKQEFKNLGMLNEETWDQYPQPLVFDNSGWLYCGIGQKEAQVVAYHPATGRKVALIPKEQRQKGAPGVFRGVDGNVYAKADGWGLHLLSEGVATPSNQVVSEVKPPSKRDFPDGSKVALAYTAERKLFIRDKGAEGLRLVNFDYVSKGANIYSIVTGPGDMIYGSTGIPLRIWSYDPATGKSEHTGLGDHNGHINQFVRSGDKLFGAVYSGGQLWEFDPSQPNDATNFWGVEGSRPALFSQAQARIPRFDEPGHKNPALVHSSKEATDLYGRPNAVLAHPDGRHILVGGKASRVVLGSGMLVYDRESKEGTIIDRADLVPDQGINSLTALPDGSVLVGTSIHPPTAGSPGPAKAAMLYRFDMKTRAITSKWPIEPGSPAVLDTVVQPDGRVFGLAEPNRFFVFDPIQGKFLHDEAITGYGNIAGFMAPRCLINGPDGFVYALFKSAVVQIDPKTLNHRAISRPPVPISAGIAISGNQLYFACGSSLFSCSIDAEKPKPKP